MNLMTTVAALIEANPEDFAKAMIFIERSRNIRLKAPPVRSKEASIEFRRARDKRVSRGKAGTEHTP